MHDEKTPGSGVKSPDVYVRGNSEPVTEFTDLQNTALHSGPKKPKRPIAGNTPA